MKSNAVGSWWEAFILLFSLTEYPVSVNQRSNTVIEVTRKLEIRIANFTLHHLQLLLLLLK